MGDAPLAYVEGAGGVRVAENEIVAVGKNDVRLAEHRMLPSIMLMNNCRSFRSRWEGNGTVSGRHCIETRRCKAPTSSIDFTHHANRSQCFPMPLPINPIRYSLKAPQRRSVSAESALQTHRRPALHKNIPLPEHPLTTRPLALPASMTLLHPTTHPSANPNPKTPRTNTRNRKQRRDVPPLSHHSSQ